MLQQSKDNREIIVFDLGGTHFRSGTYSKENGLQNLHQQASINYQSMPGLSAHVLKELLVNYLAENAHKLAANKAVRQVSISLGAAVNGYSGVVYGSGPMWGDDTTTFDLKKRLFDRVPEFDWHVINDVTASLLHYVSHQHVSGNRKVLLLTISTGIACRLFDMQRRLIPLDEFGLQGEIGHLPVSLDIDGQPLKLKCDCGEQNHLSAFSSGHGIIKLKNLLAKKQPLLWQKSKLAKLCSQGLNYETAMAEALASKDKFANKLLYLATKNIADVLRSSLAIDPEIDQIILTGGVATNLKNSYRDMLIKHFTRAGIYLTSNFAPKFFEDRLIIADNSLVNNLIGAALYATTYSKQQAS